MKAQIVVLVVALCAVHATFAGSGFGPSIATARSASISPHDGPGVVALSDDRACVGRTMSHFDGTWESHYRWEFAGERWPYYGAFADSFHYSGTILCAQFYLTRASGQSSRSMDIYVWEDLNGCPGRVLFVRRGVALITIAPWPTVATYTVPLSFTPATSTWWIGCWGNWPNQAAGWDIAADRDGPGGGRPMTFVAPGVGFPPGWQEVSDIFGFNERTTKAVGIAIIVDEGPQQGACCLPNQLCILTTEAECAGQSGNYMGDGTTCEPDPCLTAPARTDTWGRIKALYQ